MGVTLTAQGWDAQATSLLLQYVKTNEVFTCAQAFRWCFSQGLPEQSVKKIGPLFRKVLIKTNMVRVDGEEKSDEPQAHGRKVTRYASMQCKYQDGDSVREYLRELVFQFRLRKIDADTAVNKAYEFGLTGRK